MRIKAAAAIVLFITQTNAMESPNNTMDSCSFAHKYDNNFKKLEERRAQLDPTSKQDPDPIRYWVINPLDHTIIRTAGDVSSYFF